MLLNEDASFWLHQIISIYKLKNESQNSKLFKLSLYKKRMPK